MAAEIACSGCAGLSVSEEEKNGFRIHRLKVSDEGAKNTGIPSAGSYITVTVGRLWSYSGEQTEQVYKTLSELITELAAPFIGDKGSVLVCCLGNRKITSDAVGPLCADRLIVTGHLRELQPELYRALGEKSVYVLTTGVAGETGIETCELIRAAVRTLHPSLVIAIDALAARDVDRLATAVQLSDAGISPGSGVGNRRKAINRDSVGAPVLSVGVPTVVHSSTLVWDALSRAGIKDESPELKHILENERSFFVTPKEADLAVSAQAEALACAINLALIGIPRL